MVLRPGIAGEVLKINSIVMSPFTTVTESAGVPFTVKSLALTVTGSTGSLTLIVKSVGGTKIVLPQPVLVTEQDVGVGVGVAADCAQYLFRTPAPPSPPQII